MNLINKRFIIIEKKKDFNSFSLYLAKDNKNNQLHYIIFQIQNNLLINNFNLFIEFIIEQKKSLNPAIIYPIDIFQVDFIDDVAINSPTFLLLYPYEDRILLEEYIEKKVNNKDEIFNNIIKINKWIENSDDGKFGLKNCLILIDPVSKPYLLPIFPLNIDSNNFKKVIEVEIPDKNISLSEELNFELIFSYFDNSNSVSNYLFNIAQWIFNNKLNIFEENFCYPSYEKPSIYNFINFPPSFLGYCEDYLSIIQKKGFFNFLSLNASPDKYSLFYDIVDKIIDKYLNEIQFLQLKPELLSNDISRIKHSIVECFYLLSMDRPLIIQINNFNVADNESLKLINSLIEIKNLHYPIIFIVFNYKDGNQFDCKIESIDFSTELELQNLIKNLIINSYSRLLYLGKDDVEFLNTLEYNVLISLIATNPFNISCIDKSKVLLKQDFIRKSVQNEIDILVSSILENDKNKEFFLYFLFFEKPTEIKYFKEIFSEEIFNIVNKFLKNKLLFIDEKNRINSNLISTMRLIFQHLLKIKFERKTIIEKISFIYLKYIDDLNRNEVFLCFKYLCELKKYSDAAKLIDFKILLPLSSEKKAIKNLFFSFLQNQFNYGKTIDSIEDIYSRLIFKLFYLKLKYLDNDKKLESLVYELVEISSKHKFHYRFILEKILYYINIHNTEKIEKDINLLQNNFLNLPEHLKKLFLYARAEDYFSRYDHKNSIQTAKEAIKILDLDRNFDKSLFLPIMHRMVNSIIYSSSYKKANSYLKYFLRKALEYKDIKYIFYAYNNLGVVNYRNKEFEKARNFMINASLYAQQLKDKTLMFVSYNNLNLFEMDKQLRIRRSKKMLDLAPFLTEKTYLILSFCNIFLYLLEEGNFQEIFNIILKYKSEIFQRFENYSQFTIRRFLHLYTILLFPFYIFEKKEYLKIFYENLIKIENKIENLDEKSELRYIYKILRPLMYFLICQQNLQEKEAIKVKNELKEIFINYSSDKDKITNTEFFATLLGIYGILLFNDDEFLNLLKTIVDKFGNDPKVCNIDLSIYYRIRVNKIFTDSVVIRYLEKYFKLHDVDPWSSSGIYFKSYIFLFYLKLLKNTKNIEKLKLYLKIFKKYFQPFFEFIDSNLLFFPNLEKEFSDIVNLAKKIDNNKAKENLKSYGISSINFIKLPKDEYDKDYYKNLLYEFAEKFNFDRAMLYLYENKEMKLKEKICMQSVLYFDSEPPFNFSEGDITAPREPIYKKLKNSDIAEILYLPIYFVNAIPRIILYERHDKKYLQHFLLRGYIYFDSKIPKNRTIQYQTLQFCSLYLSELFERTQLEKVYMHDYLTRVLTRENFFKKCVSLINLNRQSIVLAFLMIDIDNFKHINDTFGHQKGDIVLSKIAQTIKTSLRTIDIIGRYGGEEFTVCLPDTSSDNAYIIAERIRTNIENSNFLLNGTKITVSIGISLFPQDGIFIEQIINKADKAMYRAKNKGKNRTEIYNVE